MLGEDGKINTDKIRMIFYESFSNSYFKLGEKVGKAWSEGRVFMEADSSLKRYKLMIRLLVVQEKDRELLWNINQKYLYEMTNYYDDPMDAAGNYHYGYFDAYFSDPQRTAYFLYDDEALVGFAMLHSYSCVAKAPDHTMAEFTIFPAYRRRHLAFDAANMILEKHPGRWEIKYNEKNIAAKQLWNKVAAPYSPEVFHLNDTETVLLFTKESQQHLPACHQETCSAQ